MKRLRAMNKAVFLDRDGVVNIERGDYTYRVEDFRLTDNLAANLRRLKDRGFLLIVVSNQSGIAKGLYGHSDVEAVHARLAALLAEEGVAVDALYYCPHHPGHGKCLCRKPDSLMLEKALSRFRIGPSVSWLIGDMERDLEAAGKVGVRGLLVEPNEGIEKAVDRIVGGE